MPRRWRGTGSARRERHRTPGPITAGRAAGRFTLLETIPMIPCLRLPWRIIFLLGRAKTSAVHHQVLSHFRRQGNQKEKWPGGLSSLIAHSLFHGRLEMIRFRHFTQKGGKEFEKSDWSQQGSTPRSESRLESKLSKVTSSSFVLSRHDKH